MCVFMHHITLMLLNPLNIIKHWRSLTDEERTPLLKMEKADVERYNRELAEYKAREVAEYPDVVDV